MVFICDPFYTLDDRRGAGRAEEAGGVRGVKWGRQETQLEVHGAYDRFCAAAAAAQATTTLETTSADQ